MSDQLYLLPEIDREATKRRVESALAMARFYRLFGSVRREMPVTPAYTPRYHGSTNKVAKVAEEIAVSNADQDQLMKDDAERVERVVRRLRYKEKEIIQKTYLDDDPSPHSDLWAQMHMSRSTFYRMRDKAIYNIAFMLRLEVSTYDRPVW